MNVDEKKLRDIANEMRTLAKSNASNKVMAKKDYICAGGLLRDAIKAGGLSSAKHTVVREAIEDEISRPLDDDDRISGRHRNDVLLSVARNVTEWSLGSRFDSSADFLLYLAEELQESSSTSMAQSGNNEAEGLARVLAVADPETARILAIADDTTLTADERMRAIVAIDHRFYAKDSPSLAIILHTTDANVRKGQWWRIDRRNWLAKRDE